MPNILYSWILPLLSAIIWLAMIIAMFAHWMLSGKPMYRSEQRHQTIAYISDVGAGDFKPLFIAMGTTSVVLFDVAFLMERWLRHRGHLVRVTSKSEKTFNVLAIIFAIIGAAGFILLSIFDTLRHKTLHDLFIAFFIGGYVISAVFVCAQYQRLGVRFREFKIFRLSFWMKLVFIVVEVALAITFGALNKTKRWNAAAVVEWVIALVYTFWVLSFVIDFLPAASPKNHHMNMSSGPNIEEAALASEGVAHDDSADRYGRTFGQSGDVHYPSGTTASGGVSHGFTNGHNKSDPRGVV